jgi:DNA topoisomerase-1
MNQANWITRTRRGNTTTSFAYAEPDGTPITDKERKEYFRSLVIPPAWRDVRINPSKTGKVLAIGYDKAGKRQAIYHPKFRAKQDKAKFERILAFAEKLPALRRQVERDLARPTFDKEKVLACAVKLMDTAYFRVGNDNYAKQNQTYGVTTLRSKHAEITTTSVTFDFVGKSGKHQHKKISDRQLARIIKQLDELPGYELFRYVGDDGKMHDIHSKDVNEYIKKHTAETFTAKDFRTWGGTLLASAQLAALERAENEKQRKKIVTQTVKNVAKHLGNTPAVTRSSYIDPRVINAYVDSDDLTQVKQTVQTMRPPKYLSRDEQCVLHLLQRTATARQ